MQSTRCAGLILSGGLSKRMGGRNKALMELAGRPLLSHVVNAIRGLFPELILATRSPETYAEWQDELQIIEDVYEIQSPLAGIHSGFVHSAAEYLFCTACDTPLIRTQLVQRLLLEIRPGIDVVVPWDGMYFQPLCAIYRKSCRPVIEAQLREGDRKIDRMFSRVNVRKIHYRELRTADPDFMSFFNINQPEDLKTAAEMMASPDALGA